MLGEREAKKWKGLALADKRVPKSLSVASSVRYIRMQQVSAVSRQDIENLLSRIRQSKAIPKLTYHFEQHGAQFGARDEQEYLQRMREHLSREDLRVFTYLRGRRQVPFWELRRYQSEWLEAVRTSRGWEFKESWEL